MEETREALQSEEPLSSDKVEENAKRILGRLNDAFNHTKLPEFHRGDAVDYFQEEQEERKIVFSVPRDVGTTEKYAVVYGADYVTINRTTNKGGSKLVEERVIVQPKSPKGATIERESVISYEKLDSTGTFSTSRNTEDALEHAERLTVELEGVLIPIPVAAKPVSPSP